MNGSLIVVEGADGTGKSSLCDDLADCLKSVHDKVLLFSFPGSRSGTLGKVVNEMHHNPSKHGIAEIDQTALQCLHIAAHLDTITSRILPAIQDDSIVVLDRYWWSTFVYGVVGGANREVISKLIEAEVLAWGGLKPATLILVDRETPFREEHSVVWNNWRNEYLALAETEGKNYPVHVVVNDSTRTDAVERIWNLLANEL